MAEQHDAWSDIPKGSASGVRVERRADPAHPLDFFRARDEKGRYMLILKGDELPMERPPSLAGLEVCAQQNSGRPDELVVKLRDSEQLSIFRALSADILEATRELDRGDSLSGARRVVHRIKRWQELLKKRKDQVLTRQAIIGLVGELLFLRDMAMQFLPLPEAVGSWRGSMRDEQDFAIRDWIIEIKTQLSTADQFLKISSEAQLDTASGPIVLIHQTLAASTPDEPSGITLNGLVETIRSELLAKAASTLDILEAGLIAAGYTQRPEYDAEAWLRVRSAAFEVTEDFPKLVPQSLPPGIRKVTYTILPSACADFERDETWLKSTVFHDC